MTGLIYVGIIAVWAVVLVPAWLRRHDHRDPERSVDRFSRSLQVLSQRDSVLGIPLHSSSADGRESGEERPDVAPEILRIRREDVSAMGARVSGMIARPSSKSTHSAAARRRVVLAVLSVGLVVVAGLVAAGVLLPVALAAPSVLLVAFVAAARHQVRTAQRRRTVRGQHVPAARPVAMRPQERVHPTQASPTWEARPTTLPTYVTAPPAAEFPRVIDTATPGAWTAAAMLERAQQQKARAERMAAAKAEAIARAKAEQAAAEARSRDEEFLAQQSAAWQAQDTSAPVYRPRAVNE